jgi:N-acetylmuramoyl-L-alanine amidase
MRSIVACFIIIGIMLVVLGPGRAEAESVIAIDVGHSKSSPGAISARGIPEFEFNRGLASVVLNKLSSDSINAFLIGADGQKLALRKRSEQASAGNATFLLSIHHDSVKPQYLQKWHWQGGIHRYSDKHSGYSLLVSRKNVDSTLSLRCASEIGAALRKQGFHPSPHHAERIPGESKEWADEKNGVYYYDNLSVLKNANCPAVILEAGIIVNRNDEQEIQTAKTRQAIANSVKHGLTSCGILK